MNAGVGMLITGALLWPSGFLIGMSTGHDRGVEERDAAWEQKLEQVQEARRVEVADAMTRAHESYGAISESAESMGVALERARVAGCAEVEIPDGLWCNRRFYKMYVKKGVHYARPVVR